MVEQTKNSSIDVSCRYFPIDEANSFVQFTTRLGEPLYNNLLAKSKE